MSSDEKAWTLTLPDGPLDTAAALRLRREARRAFSAGTTTLILDLHGVQYIDSLGVSCLVQVVRQAPAGARIVLVGLTRHVRTVARVTRLDELVEIHEGADGALPRAG